MKKLEINLESATQAHENANKRGKLLLEDLFGKSVFLKSVTERIKTFADVLKELDLTQEQFDKECVALTVDEIAYKQLKLIVKALNEGWVPDWTNGNWDKYVVWFKMGDPSGLGFSCVVYDYWNASSHVGSRLCFKSQELAKYAGTQFTDIYKNFMTI